MPPVDDDARRESSYYELAGPALYDASDLGSSRSPGVNAGRRNCDQPGRSKRPRLLRWLFCCAGSENLPAAPGAIHHHPSSPILVAAAPDESGCAGEYLRLATFLLLLAIGYLFNRGVSVWLHLPSDGHKTWRASEVARAPPNAPPPSIPPPFPS